METKNSPRKIWFILSIICFVFGIVVWIPNIVLGDAKSFWILTIIINPLGMVFGYIGKSRFGMILNGIMSFSFFIFMFIGYLINALFGGKP
ncbi:hypothetical protein [Paenibacillus sp. Soil522]|uniref:hypothetical protein n=1 Tax=Paenibacillus sp. Soil522 TaxID=1736388 RepID=UPI0006FBA21F|nr:hypothetical protein [Paenibacillus sp. Soil522]KRE30276.1 hypothetical protein ASG81_25385 [Paenibacillus sp. Soil522]